MRKPPPTPCGDEHRLRIALIVARPSRAYRVRPITLPTQMIGIDRRDLPQNQFIHVCAGPRKWQEQVHLARHEYAAQCLPDRLNLMGIERGFRAFGEMMGLKVMREVLVFLAGCSQIEHRIDHGYIKRK